MLVENAEYGALAVHSDVDGKPQIVLDAVVFENDAAALMQLVFGDVAARKDLDTRDEPREMALRQVRLVYQHTVDAIPQTNHVGHGFDMNIAGPLINGSADYMGHQFDDGIFFGLALGRFFSRVTLAVGPEVFYRMPNGVLGTERKVELVEVKLANGIQAGFVVEVADDDGNAALFAFAEGYEAVVGKILRGHAGQHLVLDHGEDGFYVGHTGLLCEAS